MRFKRGAAPDKNLATSSVAKGEKDLAVDVEGVKIPMCRHPAHTLELLESRPAPAIYFAILNRSCAPGTAILVAVHVGDGEVVRAVNHKRTHALSKARFNVLELHKGGSVPLENLRVPDVTGCSSSERDSQEIDATDLK